MHPSQARMHLHHTVLVTIALQLSLILPTLTCLILHYYMKEPYHTSILFGRAWLQELLHGHPERICTKLGVHKEQLAIFLYTSVTGLSIHHVGE